jgi:DnaK suppressor protein
MVRSIAQGDSVTRKQILALKAAMERELEDAIRATARRRDGIAVEQSVDTIENIGYAVERELALANLSRESILARQIQAALARIADGTFGFCQKCDKPIADKRLLAVPWTPLCVRCQESVDAEKLRRAAA